MLIPETEIFLNLLKIAIKNRKIVLSKLQEVNLFIAGFMQYGKNSPNNKLKYLGN